MKRKPKNDSAVKFNAWVTEPGHKRVERMLLIAKECNIRYVSVHAWRYNGVPLYRVPTVSRITGIPRHQLRPDAADLWETAA